MDKLTDYGQAKIPTIDLTSWILSGWSWVRSDDIGYKIVARKLARSQGHNKGGKMSRVSTDELAEDGTILNGFDYNLQVWVNAGRIMRCGHPSHLGNLRDPSCNASLYRGEQIRDIVGHEVRVGASR